MNRGGSDSDLILLGSLGVLSRERVRRTKGGNREMDSVGCGSASERSKVVRMRRWRAGGGTA